MEQPTISLHKHEPASPLFVEDLSPTNTTAKVDANIRETELAKVTELDIDQTRMAEVKDVNY